jgi:hypothetical protein
MIKTSEGLPNTCSNCGRPVGSGYWYSENADSARAGVGLCSQCNPTRTPQAASTAEQVVEVPQVKEEPVVEPQVKRGKKK